MRENRWQEAKAHCSEICQADRQDPAAWQVLGVINGQLGLWREAMGCWRTVIALQPENMQAQHNLGLAFHVLEQYEEAVAQFQKNLRSNPDYAESYHGLGCSWKQLYRPEKAAESFRKALHLKPGLVQAHNDLGMIYKGQGKPDMAIACFREALRIAPNYTEAHSNLLLAMHYVPNYDASIVFHEHCLWAETHAAALKPCNAHTNVRDPQRRLRIGYISPDLRTHSVAFFFAPLLANHDAENFEVVCYADVARRDHVTGYFQSIAQKWRDICKLSNDAVARLIMQDRIDILVDLAGHTGRRRMLILARKPAPVQVTYLGYPDTTGLSTIDYRITDGWADPPGETEQLHTEELFRLPRGFLCYRSVEDSPAVAPLPASIHGHITFGSFNNLAKITPEVIAVWASILRAVPGSRLMLKSKSLEDEATVKRYEELFSKEGISAARLDFAGWVSVIGDHIETYRHVDIALDPFPYNGATTTCEALWMGVPVIVLAGSAHAGRVGVSLLNQIELPELIATNSEDYIAMAVALAENPKRLALLRKDLRTRMQDSPLCDGQAFARDVEEAYREMWRRWCATGNNV